VEDELVPWAESRAASRLAEIDNVRKDTEQKAAKTVQRAREAATLRKRGVARSLRPATPSTTPAATPRSAPQGERRPARNADESIRNIIGNIEKIIDI
jgi:hypothetical protein